MTAKTLIFMTENNTFVAAGSERETVLSYLAGFLEGEGSVCFRLATGKYPSLIMSAGQNVAEPIRILCETFSGGFHTENIISRKLEIDGHAHFRWTVTQMKAVEVLNTLMPYFRYRGAEFQGKIDAFLKARNERGKFKQTGRPRKYS